MGVDAVSEDILRKAQVDEVLALSVDGLGREDISVELSIEVEDVRLVQRVLSRAGLLPEYFGAHNG